LVVRPSTCSFCIAHFTFTSTLRFHMGLIQPSTFCLLMCDCEHKLDAFGTHLSYYMFGGQQITTHNTIRNIMYVLTQKSEHVVWREQWYAFTSRVSLCVDL
jgi:hypothetical protein